MSRARFLAAVSLAAFIPAAPAAAQAEPSAMGEDGTIIVTAQLREQSLLDVPVTVTAYDGDFLDRLGITDFEEASRYVPGFDVQNQSPNNPGFVMRGITSDSGTAFGEPRVSVYQDGVSISKSRGSYVELFDLERLEVAKGPQSTLYGRGALIGAVNIVQNKADIGGPDASLTAAYGNYDQYLLEAMANVPTSETTAVRIAGRYRYRAGYVDNLAGGDAFNSVDTAAVRGSFRFEPNETTRFDLIANYQDDSPAGTSFKSMNFLPANARTGAVLGASDPWSGAALDTVGGFEGDRPLGLEREVWGVTGIGRIGLGPQWGLTSITAYRAFDSLEIFDADGISLPALTAAEGNEGKQFSQELRLTFESDDLTAFVGASYFREKGEQRVPTQFDERVLLARIAGALNGPPLLGLPSNVPAPLSVFDSTAFTSQLLLGVAAVQGYALSVPLAQDIADNLKSDHLESYTNYGRTEAIDIFADATWALFDRFELGAGVRYTHDDKRSGISSAVLNGRSILGGFIGALGQADSLRTQLLQGLAVPGAADIPPSLAYPVPLFGLAAQPTANNGDIVYRKLKDEGFTWRVNARYELSPATSIYASYSRGRRPEELSATTPSTPTGPGRFDRIDAETVDSFELGARTERMGGALYLDGALFYYRYNDFQTVEQQGTQFVTVNAGEAESYGAELQARWRASDWLELFGTYAYNHSRFKTGVRDGNRFRLSPDHSASLGATLGFAAGPGRVDFTPTATYQSKIFFDDDNDRPELQTLAAGALVADLAQDEFQDGYALVNFRLGYTLDKFRVEGFVTNLFDEDHIKDAGNTGDSIGMPTFIAGEPRLYGGRVMLWF